MHIFYGIIGIILGFLCIIYAYPIKRFTGSMGWAEKMFGIGGTSTGIKVIGLLIIVCSFLWMTGTLGDVFRSLFGQFFGSPNAKKSVQSTLFDWMYV